MDNATFKFKENGILLFKDIIKLELCKFCYLYKSDHIPHALNVLMPSNEMFKDMKHITKNYHKHLNIPMHKIIVVSW